MADTGTTDTIGNFAEEPCGNRLDTARIPLNDLALSGKSASRITRFYVFVDRLNLLR